jgi:hypothetical protein
MMTTMLAVAAGRYPQSLMVWCGAGGRQPEVAEMGIKQKWEQCECDKGKFLFSKIVSWVYFYSYPTAFPVYERIFGIFLAGCDYSFRPLPSLRSTY